MSTRDATVWFEIDGNKLRDAIGKRSLKQSDISRTLGCGNDIANAIKRDKIKKPIMKLLTSEYGITAKDVQKDSNVNSEMNKAYPEEIIIAPQISEEQWGKLAELIKTAITEALKEI